ncbi:response regulator transcription factor [Streptomyces sp. NPDC015346]|uniref:response regulator transcription factor n=1 Tax=Streptomyces sp. NPDC015346 TaxID=3364954 RepID=UPI0036F5E386
MTVVADAPVGVLEWQDACRPQRVLIVDENELIQAGLRSLLDDAPWVATCFLSGSIEEAIHIVRRHQPQVVLVSASLGGRSGPELCEWLKERMPHVKVVLMSGEGRIPGALATSLGAVGALSKHMSRRALVNALKCVAEGSRVFPKGAAAPQVQLSRRELDVLQHLAKGLSNPETARRLNLSRHTVKQHTSAVYRKLGVPNRASAAIRAQELGLVSAGDGASEPA